MNQDHKKILNLAVKNVEQTNKRLELIFENVLKEIEAKVIKYRTSLLRGGKIKPFKEERLLRLQKEVSDELVELRKQSGAVIRSGYVDNYKNTYYLEAYAIEKSVNKLGIGSYFLNIPKLDMNTVRASFDARIGGHVFKDRTLRVQRAMQYLLQDAVAQNIIEGESVKTLAKNIDLINEVFENGLNQTTRIARTELLKAYSIGNEQAASEAEKSGVELSYQWSSALDQKTRPDHVKADGQMALIIDGKPQFTVGGVKFSSPRLPVNPTGSKQEAKQVINCRCSRLDLPYGIKPTKRVAKKKDGKTWVDVSGDMTAVEWVKKEYGITIK